jgi:hypothetical protein
MKASSIIRANRKLVNVILQKSRVKFFQRLIQIPGAVDIDTVIFDYHPREALAILDIHIFRIGAPG